MDKCDMEERCQCGGGYEHNYYCDINEKEYDKLPVNSATLSNLCKK